jgi:Flp pilus assembly protein TadD
VIRRSLRTAALACISILLALTLLAGRPGNPAGDSSRNTAGQTAATCAADACQPDRYAEALLDLEPDRAIRLLCSPLNQSLAHRDYVQAARIIRMIAIAFRLDENDGAAAQAALVALKLNPADPNCRFQAAEYLFRDGSWQDSERLLEELGKAGDPVIASRAKAFLCQQRGLASRSREMLEEYIQKRPDDERALFKLSHIYVMYEDAEKAAATNRKLAELCRSKYWKEIYLGRADEAENKLEKAESQFRAAGSLKPQDPLWHCQLAMIYMKNQKLKEADREFRQCFACRRLLSMAYSNWAVMEAFFGSQTRAEDCLDYALLLRPSSFDLAFARGVLAEKAGKLDRASSEFERAVALNPYNNSPYIHLLQIRQTDGSSLEKRLQLCNSWCKSCPCSVTAEIERGNSLRKIGKDEEALKSYFQAGSLTKGKLPEDRTLRLKLCTTHASIASIYYKRKDLDLALAQAVKFNADRPEAPTKAGLSMRPPRLDLDKLNGKARKAAEHALLADALYECNQLAEADQEYRLAQKEDPGNITYHSCLLKVLLDKKDYGAAAQEDAAVSHHVVTHLGEFFKNHDKKPVLP